VFVRRARQPGDFRQGGCQPADPRHQAGLQFLQLHPGNLQLGELAQGFLVERIGGDEGLDVGKQGVGAAADGVVALDQPAHLLRQQAGAAGGIQRLGAGEEIAQLRHGSLEGFKIGGKFGGSERGIDVGEVPTGRGLVGHGRVLSGEM